MQLLRRPLALEKKWKVHQLPCLFRHNTGHSQDGSQAPRGQTRQVKEGNCSMDHSQEGKKVRDSLYCGLTATCSQSCPLRKNLPLPDIHNSGKAKGDALLHQAGCPIIFCSDICWWHTFLTEWNGVSLLRWDDDNWTPEHCIQTDASGSWGCGAFLDNHWLQWCWPQKWAHHNFMVKELIPIILSCMVWGRQLAGRRVLIKCDNSSVVAAVSKQYTKEQVAMHLRITKLVLLCRSF